MGTQWCRKCGKPICNVQPYLADLIDLCNACASPPPPEPGTATERVKQIAIANFKIATGARTARVTPRREDEEPEHYCTRCKKTHPVEEFRLAQRSNGSQYRESWCIESTQTYQRERKREKSAQQAEAVCD